MYYQTNTNKNYASKSVRVVWILLISLSLGGCMVNRTHMGATVGALSMTNICSGADQYVIAGCALVGAFAGAEIMYNSDRDLHNKVFVDDLNRGPEGSSYSNWHNAETGNGGTIHITNSYTVGPIKCKDYSSTIDITNSWTVVGTSVDRNTVFGTACQLPDGQWVEKP